MKTGSPLCRHLSSLYIFVNINYFMSYSIANLVSLPHNNCRICSIHNTKSALVDVNATNFSFCSKVVITMVNGCSIVLT